MGVRKIAAWMGLVEDGRYQTDDPIDDEEATNEVYVDEPSQEVSKVSQLPTRRPAPLAPVASKEVADISRIVSVRPRSFNEARVGRGSTVRRGWCCSRSRSPRERAQRGGRMRRDGGSCGHRMRCRYHASMCPASTRQWGSRCGASPGARDLAGMRTCARAPSVSAMTRRTPPLSSTD